MNRTEITHRTARRFGAMAPHPLRLPRGWHGAGSPGAPRDSRTHACLCGFSRWGGGGRSLPRRLRSPSCTSGQNSFALASCRARRFSPLCSALKSRQGLSTMLKRLHGE